MNDSESSSPPGDDGAKSFLPRNWQELARLVDTVLDAPEERRAQVLDEVTGGDPQRHAELQRLVAECERDVPLFNRPAAERFSRLIDEEAEIPLPEMLGGRYRIEREVGHGGMARVYLARDAKHARNVAVKVIRPDVAASLGRDRFLREIGIAARLRHPNIVPLYDSGDADGVLYFVMPYEEGPSLGARLRDGPLLVGECVSLLRDVARALAYAHEQGVVHRDVKPDNVMLSGGAAVVTDFGIAKAIAVAAGGPPTDDGAELPATAITQLGVGLGTPAYMAPEQALGDPDTNHRADIYAFGCLAYELFAGKPPFHDLPTHQIIAAHVGTVPVPLSDVSTAVPIWVSRLVARCLEKDPAARPQRAQELLAALEGGSAEPNDLVRHRRRPSRATLTASALAAVVLIAAAGYVGFRVRAPSAAPVLHDVTVAVLPLLSTGDSVQRDLAYGLSDEIATALVKVPGVRVMSRRSVAASREQRNIDTEKTGRELGAQFLVMGSLKEVNGRLTVLASLVQARDGAMVWADQFDRGLDELGTVRNEIARSVGDSLRVKAGRSFGDRPRGQPARAVNPDAYRLYLLAQRRLAVRGKDFRASVDNFRRATELDTLYADAFAGLSLALALTPYFQNIPSREVAGAVRSAAERALRLDPTLAPPHVALGLVHEHAYAWDSAAVEFQTAVQLRSSDDIEPLVQYGRYLLFRGRTVEALNQFLEARRTEPASAVVSSWLSYTYYLRGQLDSALVENARALQNDSTSTLAQIFGAFARLRAGDTVGALGLVNQLAPNSWPTLYVIGVTGDTATARAGLRERERESRNRWGTATTRAIVMLGVGDTTEAMAALERATDSNELWPSLQPMIDPIFDPIRNSDRFHKLLGRVNLPVSESVVARRPVSR